jgi:hypothetical protein
MAKRGRRAVAPLPAPLDPEDSFLRETYLSLAELALIPPENGDLFLREVSYLHGQFCLLAMWDGDRVRLQARVNEVRAVAHRLQRALLALESRGELGLLDLHMERDHSSDPTALDWTGKQVEEFQRHLAKFLKGAQSLSTGALPKRGNGRTRSFMLRLLRAVECHGGNLTLDKNVGGGTLVEAQALLKALSPPGSWTDLSVSTLQRLKSGQ